MSDNNNLNRDDLFRRAVDDYPLRTDSADWDKVLSAMDEDDGSSLVLPFEQDGRRSRRRFLWLLLLLPLGGLGYYNWYGRHASHTATVAPSAAGGYASSKAPEGKGSSAGVSEPYSERPATDDKTVGNNKITDDKSTAGTANNGDAAKNNAGKDAGSNNTINDNTSDYKTVENRNTRPAKDHHSATDLPAERVREKSVSKTSASKNAVSKTAASKTLSPGTGAFASGLSTNGVSLIPRTSAGNHGNRRSRKGTGLKAKDDLEKGDDTEKELTENGQTRTGGVRTESAGRKQTKGVDSTYVHTVRSLKNSQMAGIVPQTSLISLNIRVNSKSTPGGIEKPAVKPAKKPGNNSFYAGLMVAPDMSYVKFQSVKGVGYNLGLLLGYNFNRRLALETGISYDHKKYFTDGDYFSKKNLNLPPNYYLQNVDGSCSMWEIPLNLRYNFVSGQKIKWFATTGLSTYLMTKEKYNYEYENTTTGVSWPYGWSGKNNSNYLFSVFNFSIGYQQSLGKIGDLRVEPYLRVPLAGFGRGSLPIMSSGLNIGITRRIW